MKEKELKDYILHIISQLKDKIQIESNKIELKRQWYNFKTPKMKRIVVSEFLKDIVSLINTPGLEGYLIIGIDENNGNLIDSPFKNCGLKDISEIYQLIIKNVDRPFDPELIQLEIPDNNNNKLISIFKIPPSINKPHVIKCYLSKNNKEIINYIPIRKATGIYQANRDDLDFMYYDRKNIEPEYAMEINAYKPHITFNSFHPRSLQATLHLCFQNYGTRPIVIINSNLIIESLPDYDTNEKLVFELIKYSDPAIHKIESYIRHRSLVIPANNVDSLHVTFNLVINQSDEDKRNLITKLRELDKFAFEITCEDISGNIYLSSEMIHEK